MFAIYRRANLEKMPAVGERKDQGTTVYPKLKKLFNDMTLTFVAHGLGDPRQTNDFVWNTKTDSVQLFNTRNAKLIDTMNVRGAAPISLVPTSSEDLLSKQLATTSAEDAAFVNSYK